jgi:hypothetical protein
MFGQSSKSLIILIISILTNHSLDNFKLFLFIYIKIIILKNNKIEFLFFILFIKKEMKYYTNVFEKDPITGIIVKKENSNTRTKTSTIRIKV